MITVIIIVNIIIITIIYGWFCYWFCSHYDYHDWIHGIIVLIDYPRDLDWIITPLTEIRQQLHLVGIIGWLCCFLFPDTILTKMS
jgi:hypothetical protein